MSKSKIEWTDAVWNPITGCTKISEGCRNCYAERMSKRLAGRCGYPIDNPFKVTLHPDKLEKPLKWKKPRKIFVNSMSDLFHDDVPFEFIEELFCSMENYDQHTYMVLTKRPKRMMEFIYWFIRRCSDDSVGREYHIPPHIWLGVSVENQATADERIPLLLQTPAAVRFISAEPLLGLVDLASPYTTELFNKCAKEDVLYSRLEPEIINTDSQTGYTDSSYDEKLPGIHWVIVGGESGPGARPMHPDWVRSLRDQCTTANVPFFFKQWGEWVPYRPSTSGFAFLDGPTLPERCTNHHRLHEGWEFNNHEEFPKWMAALRIGKKKAGRELDGRTWDEKPGVIHV